MDSSSMAICFLIPLLIHILVENAGAERILPFKPDNNSMHLQNNSAIVEIENELYTNLTWLNLEQREVLQDIIKDGWNASDLQQEILLFYNEETSVRRKYAAYHLLSSCFNLLNNFCSLERFEKLIKDITANTSNTQTFSFEVTKRLNQETNETELVQLFMNGCFPILSSETDDFLSQVSEMEDTEKADEIYNEFMINYANDTTQKKFRKANVLFQLLKIEEAFAIYDEIITLEPNNTEYIKKYAEALIFLERFDKAIQLYDRVLKMETENLEIVDKKLIALIKHADQGYDKANEIIFKKYFNSHLRWLNESQKRQIRRLKAEGKKSHELFTKLSEFFESSNETIKTSAIHSMEHGCIHLLYTVFGYEKAEKVLALRENSSEIFERKYADYFANVKGEGQKRIANAYMPLCRKILSFDQENVPKIMISPKINGKVFEFILDTGAFATMANKEVWEAIGKPYLHPSNRAVGGIGGHVLPLGRCRVSVEIHGKTSREWLYIIENGMMLFGRNWIHSLTIKIEH